MPTCRATWSVFSKHLLFARAISKGEPIKVFNNGDMIRDFTYIDGIAEFMKWYKSDKNPLR